MRHALYLIAGVVAALLFIAASGVMNFLFMSGQGKTPLEGYVLGGVSIGVSGFNAALPFVIASASRQRQRIRAGLAVVFFAMTLAAALFSAVGFAASNRGAVVGSREAVTARYDVAVAELAEVEGKLAALPVHRVAAVIEETISAIKQDRRWLSSNSCADATASASLAFCKGFYEARAELAAAVEADRLSGKRETLRREVDTLKQHGAGQAADPQAGLLARLSGVDVSLAQMILMCFFAGLVEFGAAFGLFFALGSSGEASGTRGGAVVEVLEPVAAAPPRGASVRLLPRRVSAG